MEPSRPAHAAPRRKYTPEFKAQLLEQCERPGASVPAVALSHGIHASLVYRWRSQAQLALLASAQAQAQAQAQAPTPASLSATATATAKTAAKTPTPTLPTKPAPFIALPHPQARSRNTQRSSTPSAQSTTPQSAHSSAPEEAIHIQVHCGPTQVHIHWPTSAADQCALWLSEALPQLSQSPLLSQSALPPPLPQPPPPLLSPSHRPSTVPSTQARTPQ